MSVAIFDLEVLCSIMRQRQYINLSHDTEIETLLVVVG